MESKINFKVSCTQMVVVYTECSISYANEIKSDLEKGITPNIKNLVCYEDVEFVKRKTDNNSPLVVGLLLDTSRMLDELTIAGNRETNEDKYNCKRSVKEGKLKNKKMYILEYTIKDGSAVRGIYKV